MAGIIRKSIYDLFELYIPGHHILNLIPNNFYKDFYVYQDVIKGIRAVKFEDTDMFHKIQCENILDYNIEDILAMKLHQTYYQTYNLNDDKAAAKHLFDLLELH